MAEARMQLNFGIIIKKVYSNEYHVGQEAVV